jgi:hypothetical protein
MKTLSKIALLITALSAAFSSFAFSAGSARPSNSTQELYTHSFTGRRGGSYLASWDASTYAVTISTSDGTFPWDWISFVGERGAVALAGHADVASTLAFSDPDPLPGLQPGDLMRVKAWDNLSLAHLSKIGLVIGSGPAAFRSWLGSGEIQEYYLAPDYVGYRVLVNGRNLTVRLSHLHSGPLQVVGVISVEMDDPTDAYLYFASDLEPSDRYQQAVEYRNDTSTRTAFDVDAETIVGTGTGEIQVYLYASSPLLSWSANNLPFNTYLMTDDLDGVALSSPTDARVAVKVAAAAEQHFYIGSSILPDEHRQNPAAYLDLLRQRRLDILNNLPLMEQSAINGFDFVSVLSNLFLTYLINPGGNIHYTDKVFPYTADNLMILTEAPEILPAQLLQAYRDYLVKLGSWQYTSPTQGLYWDRTDYGGDKRPPLPEWYAGNIPELVFRSRHDTVSNRFQYSDLFATAEYLMSFAAYHRVTGDTSFISSNSTSIRLALQALQTYSSAYREYYSDDYYYPHIMVPMGDLYYIKGVYPAESAMAIYAMEDTCYLLNLLGSPQECQSLLPVIEHMRVNFNDYFWVEEAGYYLPRRDERSSTGQPGDYYQDFWVHTVYPILTGDIGSEKLPDMLDAYTSSRFLDADNNFRWLSTDSESYRPDSYFQDGYVMEGGFFNGAPNVAPAIAYYLLNQPYQGDQLAQELYFDVWTRMGPYETMRQWDTKHPGLYLEASIYIESLISTLWLIKEAMGIKADGLQVTIAPKMVGEFHLKNLNVVSGGKRAVINYGRYADGCEYIEILSNTGLHLQAPQAGTCYIPPTPTPTPIIAPAKDHYLYLSLVRK